MPVSFKCPSCNAPLDYEGKMMQKCKFCGSNVIVPTSTVQNSSAFGGFGNLDFSDLSSLTGKALKIAEIQRFIQSGQKIQAIKIFRETFGVGLKEAKDAIDAMERGESVDLSHISVQTNHRQRTQEMAGDASKIGEIKRLAQNGNKIEAIKLFRETFNVGLKEAKEAVEALERGESVDVLAMNVQRASSFLTSPAMARNSKKFSDWSIFALVLIGIICFAAAMSYYHFVIKPARGTATENSQIATEILKFGGEGNGAGRFEDNRNVAVDAASGRIYSSSYEGGRIQVFDGEGKFLTQWIADPKMYLNDMTADRKGNLYILQSKGIYIYQGESGKLLQKSENYDYDAFALTLDGKLVVIADKKILILDANSLKPIQEFKDAAESANATANFRYVAVDGNNRIYTVDNRNGDICVFSADGKFLNRFKTGTTVPRQVAIDNKGRVFVANVSEIKVFDADGKPINSFPTTQAFGMAFNDADELFVAARPFVVKYKINF